MLRKKEWYWEGEGGDLATAIGLGLQWVQFWLPCHLLRAACNWSFHLLTAILNIVTEGKSPGALP